MDTHSRLLEYQDKECRDSRGNLHEGEIVIEIPDGKSPRGFTECVVSFHLGKVHNSASSHYAAFFLDGHRESWENGRFISAIPAWELQEKLPLD